MNEMRRWTRFAWLLAGPAFFSPMGFWNHNAGDTIDVAAVFAIATIVFALVLIAGRLTGMNRSHHVLAAQLAVVAFWSWEAVPGDVFESAWSDLIAGLAWVAVAGAVGFGLRSFVWLPVVIGAALGAAALSIIITTSIGYFGGSGFADVAPPVVFDSSESKHDVLVLVLDAYASPRVLSDVYGYDVSNTVLTLEANSFQVPLDAQSNYRWTIQSVSSMLLLDYHDDNAFEGGGSAYGHRFIGAEAGLLVWMNDAGFEVTKLRSGWEGATCGRASRCEGGSRIGGTTGWILLNRTPLRRVVIALAPHPYVANSLRVLEQIPVELERAAANDRPDLIFAHVMTPHGPYGLDATCELFTESDRSDGELYLDQIECVNRYVEQYAALAAELDVAMLIVGDHGSELRRDGLSDVVTLDATDFEEMFGVFVASRTPNACPITGRTLVNIVRGFVGCVGGVEVSPLVDRYWNSRDRVELIEVTDRLGDG